MKALIIIGDISFAMKTGRQEAIITPVGNGQSALDTIGASSPDLVILDCSLPGMKLQDLIGKFRRLSDVPILVLDESKSDNEKSECLEAGADEYLQCLPGSTKIKQLVTSRKRTKS